MKLIHILSPTCLVIQAYHFIYSAVYRLLLDIWFEVPYDVDRWLLGFKVACIHPFTTVANRLNLIINRLFPAVLATRSGAMTFAQSSGLLSSRNFAWNGWNNVAPCFSTLQAETVGRISSLHRKVFLNKGVNFFDMKSKLLDQTRPFSEGLGSFCSRFFQSRKGEWGSGHS
uniref:Cadmium-induced protein AS8 isoform X2 n=1 Tax=Rhizophora mucronata TaxID=61149 RepID=A0A2P2JL33_RHIMU